MICEQMTEQLGLYLDGELPSAAQDDVEAHLLTCSSCQADLEALRDLAAELTTPSNVPVPETLWTAIEQRLDAELQTGASRDAQVARIPAQAEASGSRKSAVRLLLFRRAPLGLAAAIVLAIGLSVFSPDWTDSTAQASSVDFSVLLNALPIDAQKAFRKFLAFYDAKEGTSLEAKRYAPDLNFELPETLPGGFHLEAVYLLRFGHLPGVAASYERDGEFLGVVFHRPVHKENLGPHKDYPCMVGQHEGHKVSVGEWKLVHLMDPTTCHCVLSRLDEQTELVGVMAAITPDLSTGHSQHNH